MDLFGKSHKKLSSVIGLDIDVDQATLIEIAELNKNAKLTRHATASFNSEYLAEGVIQDIDAFSEALRPHLESFQSNKVCLGLANNLVTIRQVSVDDDLSPEDIEENISMEAERALPLALEDIYFDFWQLPVQDEDKLTYLMVACPRNVITSRIEALALLKLKVINVTLNDFALANFVLPEKVDAKSPNCALVYFRQDSADIIISQDNDHPLYDTTGFNGTPISDAIQTLWDLIHIQQQDLNVQQLYIAGEIANKAYDLNALSKHLQCDVLEFDVSTVGIKNEIEQQQTSLSAATLAIALAHEVQQ